MSWCLTNWCDALDALAQREFFFYSIDEIRSNFFLAMSLSLSIFLVSISINTKEKQRKNEGKTRRDFRNKIKQVSYVVCTPFDQTSCAFIFL